MPRENPISVDRGPGSISPDFNAPSVDVATPGRQLQPEETDAERFRDAVFAFGSGLGRAVSARSAINSQLKALKDRSMRQVEGDLNRAGRSFQARRLQTTQRKRREIIDEAGERGMEWAERQFRARMMNSSSEQEASLWEQAWRGASQQVSRENAQEKQQAFNSAKMTMQQVGLAVQEDLAENPELAAQLTGDGTGIAGRVQNHMLEQVLTSVDLDSMAEEDAELLVHQSVVQAASIADRLRAGHTKEVERSNFSLGMRQLEADFISTAHGDQEPGNLREQVEVTLRDRLSHMTIDQQMDYVRDTARKTINRLAAGEYGFEAINIEQVQDVINLTVEGDKVFTPEEQADIQEDLFRRAERTLSNELQRQVETAMADFTVETPTPDGRTVSQPDLYGPQKLLLPDADGVSQLDRMGHNLIESLLPEGTQGDPHKERLQAVALLQLGEIKSKLQDGLQKQDSDYTQMMNVLTGGVSENPRSAGNTAYNVSPETRATRSALELEANGRNPLSAQETEHLRQSYAEILANVPGGNPELLDQWQGEPITPDHPLRPTAERAQAELWSREEVVQNTGIPTDLVNEKIGMLTSGDPAQVQAVASFISGLKGGPRGSWQSFLSNNAHSEQSRAQAIYLKTMVDRGYAAFDVDGKPRIQRLTDEALDYSRVASNLRQLQNVPFEEDWLTQRVRDPELAEEVPNNLAAISKFMADAVLREDDPASYGDTDWQVNEEQLAQGIARMIQTDGPLRDWVSTMAQSQTALDHKLDEEQVASVLRSWMERDGLRIKQDGETAILLRDPMNRLGPNGADIQRWADEHIAEELPQWYRSVLIEALELEPTEAPMTLGGLYLIGRKARLVDNTLVPDLTREITPEEAFEAVQAGVVRGEFGTTYDDQQALIEPISNNGGAVMHGLTIDGQRLEIPRAVRDVIFTFPDGTQGRIEAGQALPVLNEWTVPRAKRSSREIEARTNAFTYRLGTGSEEASGPRQNIPRQ